MLSVLCLQFSSLVSDKVNHLKLRLYNCYLCPSLKDVLCLKGKLQMLPDLLSTVQDPVWLECRHHSWTLLRCALKLCSSVSDSQT